MTYKRDDGGSNAKFIEFDLGVVTDEDQHKAALTVCDLVQDATVARDLLEMLGLDGSCNSQT